MFKCPKDVAIELAEKHSKTYTKSRHFGCVAWDKVKGQPLFMGCNHPDFHAEALFLDSLMRLKKDSDDDEDVDGKERKDRYY